MFQAAFLHLHFLSSKASILSSISLKCSKRILSVSSILLFIIFISSLVDIVYPVQELPSQYLALCAFALATSVSKIEPVLPVAVSLSKIMVAVLLVVLNVVVVDLVVAVALEVLTVVLNVVVVERVVL